MDVIVILAYDVSLAHDALLNHHLLAVHDNKTLIVLVYTLTSEVVHNVVLNSCRSVDVVDASLTLAKNEEHRQNCVVLLLSVSTE